MKYLILVFLILIKNQISFEKVFINYTFQCNKWIYKYSYNSDTTLILNLDNKLIFSEICFQKNRTIYKELSLKASNNIQNNKYKNTIFFTNYKGIEDTAICTEIGDNWATYLGHYKFNFKIINHKARKLEIIYNSKPDGISNLKHVYKR